MSNIISMPCKRIINKDDYPMILDWKDYKNVHTLLPCRCQVCGKDMLRCITTIDNLAKASGSNNTTCVKCKDQPVDVIDRSKYPMVLDWSTYKNKKTKLPCRCTNCGAEKKMSILDLNHYNSCLCKLCQAAKSMETIKEKHGVNNAFQLPQTKKTLMEKYGREHGFDYEKAKQTFVEKYGCQHPMKVKEFKEKSVNTNRKNHGGVFNSQTQEWEDSVKKHFNGKWFNQQHRTDEQISITESKEHFEEYLKNIGKKVTCKEVADAVGLKNGRTNQLLHLYNLTDKYIRLTSYVSGEEKELDKFVQSLGFETTRKRFSWGEVDIYIPEMHIGFEYNGTFWHNSMKKSSSYHYDKVTEAQKEGIRLIHIWDYEWLHHRNEIEAYIQAQVGKCTKRIYARKCVVREVSRKDCESLLSYHQQHSTTAQVYLGLYYGEELVLCMLLSRLSKNIFTKNPVAQWEIRREVCSPDCSVVGGKSKVFKYFVDKYKPVSVVSYVDRAKFTGNSYLKMGFVLDHINPARYDWVYKKELTFRKRQPCIYKEMKEKQKQGQVYQVYDSGRYCYLWKN